MRTRKDYVNDRPGRDWSAVLFRRGELPTGNCARRRRIQLGAKFVNYLHGFNYALSVDVSPQLHRCLPAAVLEYRMDTPPLQLCD